MANYDTVLIRYGELSTKGKNRKNFTRRLYQNIRNMLQDYKNLEYSRTYDRIYIKLNGENHEEITEKLKKVFGISSFSFTEKIEPNIDAIKAAAVEMAKKQKEGTSFKVITKRHDKNFPMNSDGINRACAGAILATVPGHHVDVHNPDFTVQIEVREDAAYIHGEKINGAGGYPAGINGKVLLMLSGGIDSPVAAYELMKRGLEVEAIHYASPPYTSDHAKRKVLDLAGMVSEYQGSMKVHILNFTDMQLAIYKTAGDPYAVTLMRRMMYRLAEKTCQKVGALAIGTGESVGQVASQTLESIVCINQTITTPVLRPLVCYDKIEIIDLARKIGTYETSILPFEDCCTIFDPKNPVTKPTVKRAEEYESKFDWESLLESTLESDTVVVVHPDKKEESFL